MAGTGFDETITSDIIVRFAGGGFSSNIQCSIRLDFRPKQAYPLLSTIHRKS
jgi:hypothetical protein